MNKRLRTSVCLSLLLSVMTACSNGAEQEGVTSPVPIPDAPPVQTGPAQTVEAPDPNKESTVVFSMYAYNSYYEQAKKAYEAKHPNTTIDLQYVTNEFDPSGLMVERFRSKTAAEFLNGQGTDLIVIDDLPLHHYVGNGLLTNLTDWMAGDASFREEDYFYQLLQNVTQSDDNVYALPVGFSLVGLLAEEEALRDTGVQIDDSTWTWDDFNTLVQELPFTESIKYGYFEKEKSSFLYHTVSASASQYMNFVNRTAHFDSDSFVELLQQINQLEQKQAITFDTHHHNQVYFKPTEIYSITDYALRLEESNWVKPLLLESPKSEGQQAGGTYAPRMNLAINANSSVKAEAWDFMKFLLSGEAGQIEFLPVSQSAYEVQRAAAEASGVASSEAFEQLTAFILSARNPIAGLPEEIELLLFNETPAFFSGQKSAGDVAKLIQNRATTFLNE